jgi:dynactin complex subunit
MTRVLVRDKEVTGTVSYVGSTDFAPGKWIGLMLSKVSFYHFVDV